MKFTKALALGLGILALSAGAASAFTYHVDLVLNEQIQSQVQGADTGSSAVSVKGQIKTDGTLGELNVSNIIGWSFVLSDGFSNASFDHTNGASSLSFKNNGAMSATSTELLDNGEGWSFEHWPTSDPWNRTVAYFAFTTKGKKSGETYAGMGQTSGTSSTSYTQIASFDASKTGTKFTKIGQVAEIATVPVPGSALLLASGLGLLGSTRLRKNKA